MLDIKAIRQNPDSVASALQKRGITFDRARFEALDARRKAAECTRKVDALEEKLQQRARTLVRYIRDKGDFDRDNKQILDAIEDLQRLCKGGDVYDGPAYEEY